MENQDQVTQNVEVAPEKVEEVNVNAEENQESKIILILLNLK